MSDTESDSEYNEEFEKSVLEDKSFELTRTLYDYLKNQTYYTPRVFEELDFGTLFKYILYHFHIENNVTDLFVSSKDSYKVKHFIEEYQQELNQCFFITKDFIKRAKVPGNIICNYHDFIAFAIKNSKVD